jgi:hypothetical protein
MNKKNDLEMNIRNLVEAKVLNPEVTLEALLKAGTVSGIDPWDIWCGNGWILRRRLPEPGPIQLGDLEMIREVVRQELNIEASQQG